MYSSDPYMYITPGGNYTRTKTNQIFKKKKKKKYTIIIIIII